MAVGFLDAKGSNSTPSANTLTGLTVGQSVEIWAAYRASATPPSLPAGYTQLGTAASGSAISMIVYGKVATATTSNGGTATNATTQQGMAWSGASLTSSTFFAGNNGNSTNPVVPALTLSKTDSTSWTGIFAAAISQNISAATITGYTKRDTTTNTVVVDADSNGGHASNPTSLTITLASSQWITCRFEIPVPAAAAAPSLMMMF